MFFNFFVQDLLRILEFNIVEFPIATILLKSVILQMIGYINIENQRKKSIKDEEMKDSVENNEEVRVELYHKILFIDII